MTACMQRAQRWVARGILRAGMGPVRLLGLLRAVCGVSEVAAAAVDGFAGAARVHF